MSRLIERVIIDVPSHKLVRLKMPPDQHRGTLCDDVACDVPTWGDVEWSPDGIAPCVVSTSRNHKQEMAAARPDTSTGEVREVMGETVPKFYESGNEKSTALLAKIE